MGNDIRFDLEDPPSRIEKAGSNWCCDFVSVFVRCNPGGGRGTAWDVRVEGLKYPCGGDLDVRRGSRRGQQDKGGCGGSDIAYKSIGDRRTRCWMFYLIDVILHLQKVDAKTCVLCVEQRR